MVTTTAARLRAAARDDQRKLAVRERQMLHAIHGVADKIEENNPGSIHSVEFTMSSNKLYAKITYNRDRGVEDDDEGSGADHAPKPTRSQRQRAKREANQAKSTYGQGDTSCPKVGAAGDKPAADAAMADADDAAAKRAAAAEIRRLITDTIVEVVDELGGNRGEEGSKHLCETKTPFEMFGHKLKPLRLPKRSPAADMPPSVLKANNEELHKALHADGATATDRAELLRKLRRALTPRRADKAPAPPVFGQATPAPPAFGIGFAASSSFGGSPPASHLFHKPGASG